MTAMRRQGRLLKIRKPTVHDNCISLKHIPRNLTTANNDHRMCETIGKIKLARISSRAVNTRFVVKVDDMIIQENVTHIIVVFQMVKSLSRTDLFQLVEQIPMIVPRGHPI